MVPRGYGDGLHTGPCLHGTHRSPFQLLERGFPLQPEVVFPGPEARAGIGGLGKATRGEEEEEEGQRQQEGHDPTGVAEGLKVRGFHQAKIQRLGFGELL